MAEMGSGAFRGKREFKKKPFGSKGQSGRRMSVKKKGLSCDRRMPWSS